jgi:predicted Ser/Thr protein kinase
LGLGLARQPAGHETARTAAPGSDATVRETGSEASFAAAAATPFAPAGRFIPPDPKELALHFPNLEIEELLGQGGMGAVYKARQRRLDRPVALKILPPEVAADPGFAERFTREARALARLSHPHIVAVHDFGEAGGMYYFLMEFVDGVNLRQMIERGKLDPRQALAIVPQVCEALQYAHEEGVVHRDIKPENLLLDKKGRVKIADFGLAKLMRKDDAPVSRAVFALTGSRQVMGTPHYMAPEQMEHPQAVDHRADIYSLGVVFYEMLTGELPLGRFQPPSRRVQIDARLDEVVLRSLEKEPERRYQHASEVKTDLDGILPAVPGSPFPDWEAESALAGDDFSDVKSQVAWPALGLGLVGVIGVFLPLILLVIVLRFAGSAELALLLLSLPVSVPIAVGARSMARLERYSLCRAACIMAVLPCHLAWLIGLPAGVYAWIVLNQPDVRAAFQGKGARKQSGTLTHNGIPIAVGCLVMALFIGACFFIGACLWMFVGTPSEDTSATVVAPAPVQSPAIPSVSTPHMIAPRYETNRWIVGPEGPALTDLFASMLKLQPHQIERVNKILKSIYAESLKLEAQNIDQDHDPLGHLVITIKPYPVPIAKLENQLWLELDGVLSTQQQSIARLNLELDVPEARPGVTTADLVRPGFFRWGKEGARIELWRVGTWYHWNVQTRRGQYSASDPKLPVEFRSFWKD